MSCLPGDLNGAFNSKCETKDWSFNKSYCDNEFCSKFTSKRDCKYPCSYSRLKGCMFNVEYQIHVSELNLIAQIVCFVLMLIILLVVIVQLIVFYKFYRCSLTYRDLLKRNYSVIPMEQLERLTRINLDDIPAPASASIDSFQTSDDSMFTNE